MIQRPRILCLHGGGTNTRIFKAQCQALKAQLCSHFRFVYFDAFFLPSSFEPDDLLVYRNCGFFRRWLKSDSDTSGLGNLIVAALNRTMGEDYAKSVQSAGAAVLRFS